MGKAKWVLVVCNDDMWERYSPYVAALRKAGFKVEGTDQTDVVADKRPLGEFCLILIQFGLLVTENHHTRGTIDGGCNGGAVARALRRRGVRIPILLGNVGLEELTRAYRDPTKHIEVVHLDDCEPKQFVQECLNALETVTSHTRLRAARPHLTPAAAASF